MPETVKARYVKSILHLLVDVPKYNKGSEKPCWNLP